MHVCAYVCVSCVPVYLCVMHACCVSCVPLCMYCVHVCFVCLYMCVCLCMCAFICVLCVCLCVCVQMHTSQAKCVKVRGHLSDLVLLLWALGIELGSSELLRAPLRTEPAHSPATALRDNILISGSGTASVWLDAHLSRQLRLSDFQGALKIIRSQLLRPCCHVAYLLTDDLFGWLLKRDSFCFYWC